MKAALYFLGNLSQSLNMVCRGSSRLTLGSFQDEARAISTFVQSPRCFSSGWDKKDWPEQTTVPTSKEKGDFRDNRIRQGRDRPSRVKRENELKRVARELRKSRKGYNLPSTHSQPRSSLEDVTESTVSNRFRDQAEERRLEKGQAPHYHSWSPCTRNCRRDVDTEK